MEDFKLWLDARLGEVSQKSGLAEAIRYALSHWEGLTRFLSDGRIEIDSNTVERTMRPIALGRRNYLFAGSDEGGQTWSILASLINSALCRARHSADYAARRTMPNGSGTMRCLGEFAGRRAGILPFHSAYFGCSQRLEEGEQAVVRA